MISKIHVKEAAKLAYEYAHIFYACNLSRVNAQKRQLWGHADVVLHGQVPLRCHSKRLNEGIGVD